MGISSFLILILGIGKAATFVTACGVMVHFGKKTRYNKVLVIIEQYDFYTLCFYPTQHEGGLGMENWFTLVFVK